MLSSVKTLRILVLLLVCVLLPFRGAVAATMLCEEPGQTSEFTTVVGHTHHGMHGHEHVDGSAAHAGQDHTDTDTDSTGSDDGAKVDCCNICASGCHAAAMVTALPSTPGAMPVASVAFPALCVPAPDFQSAGPDRPPRAI